MHGLVLDQLLEGEGRRRPVDAPQLEEPPVEPRVQEVGEVLFDRRGGRVREGEQVAPHREQRVDAVVGQVDRPEQFESGGLGRVPELLGRCGRRLAAPPIDRRPERTRVGGELVGQEPEDRSQDVVVAGRSQPVVPPNHERGEAAGRSVVAQAGEGPERLAQRRELLVHLGGHHPQPTPAV